MRRHAVACMEIGKSMQPRSDSYKVEKYSTCVWRWARNVAQLLWRCFNCQSDQTGRVDSELLIRLGGKSHGLNTRQATPASKSRFPVKQGGGQGPIFWLSRDNAPTASSKKGGMHKKRDASDKDVYRRGCVGMRWHAWKLETGCV